MIHRIERSAPVLVRIATPDEVRTATTPPLGGGRERSARARERQSAVRRSVVVLEVGAAA